MWGGAPARRISPARHDKFIKKAIPDTARVDRQLALARQQIADNDAEISRLLALIESQQEEIKRLNDAISAPTLAGQARKIATEVAAEHGLTFFDMISQCRNMSLVRARKKAMWRIHKECTHMSLPMIGKLFGDRDHTTVLHCIRDYEAHIEAGTAW